MRVFLAVAETRSMGRAAQQLRIGQPTVSRRLAALEDGLGYPLFRRTVAGATLTAAGERLVEPARRMAEWAGEVNRAALSHDQRPQGLVRVAAAPGTAWDFVAPFAAWLRQRQPGIVIELLCSVSYLDLGRGEADLAIRPRAPTPGGDLITVATREHTNHAYATKGYAAKLPKRYGPADVGWLCWAPPLDQLPPNPQLEKMIPGFKPVFTSDSYLVLLRAAEEGLGALPLADWRHRFRRPSSLVPLEIDFGPLAKSAIHLVCAKSALEIPRVRVVAELLAEEMTRTRSP